MSGEPKRVKPWPAPPTEKSPEQVRLELRLSVLPTSLAAARDSLANHHADPALCAEATHDLSRFVRSLRATGRTADYFDPVHSLPEKD